MKTRRNLIATAILATLLIAFAAPLIAQPSFAFEGQQNDDLKVVPGQWYRLETDIVTVLFPAGGKKPMFIWWYTKAPDQIYVVKYQGLIEYFAFGNQSLYPKPEYYTRMREALVERFQDMFLRPLENDYRMSMADMYRLMILRQIMTQINATWHMPFFPFNAAAWNLSEVKNITTDRKMIGVSFAFKLVKVPEYLPGFKFAENNIMIRVRFYNTTVEETDPDTGFKFTINAGEMKMDFVVNKWVWNIDAIKELINYLKDHGINVNVPEGKSRLALWVNLASINITRLLASEEEPEGIEAHSTATHMEVGDMRQDIRSNMTQTSQEEPIEDNRPVIKLSFANETTTLGGFFRFVSSAKVKDFPKVGDVNMVPVKASYIAAGAHLRLFIGYPYFGNGSLEHDPSIGVDLPSTDATPKYTVQVPSGINQITPTVIGKYQLPLFTVEMAAILVGAASTIAVLIYAVKWKRKTPVNMVGAS